MGDGIEKVVTFEEKVCAVAADLYPGGLPDPPAWFPVDVIHDLEQQSRAAALLVRMVAADGARPDSELGRVQWSLVYLWIGLETADEARIDFCLEHLLGTSGRGWLAKRMAELRFERADLHHELRVLCVELITQFASAKARVDDGAKARAYFRTAFRNRLEARLNELLAERGEAEPQADPIESITAMPKTGPEMPVGFHGSEIVIRSLIERAGLSGGESVAIRRSLEGYRGQALADVMGVGTSTAETQLRRARKKIEDLL